MFIIHLENNLRNINIFLNGMTVKSKIKGNFNYDAN
jgi:hypothetical protein